MTIKSMTGFGRGEMESGGRTWTAELRCVNHRFLDLKTKLPRGYTALEDRIRKKVAEFHNRGRVDLVLTVQGDFSDLQKIIVNVELARTYKNALVEIAEKIQIEDDITLSKIAAYPEILVREQQEEDLDSVWEVIEPALIEALNNCEVMRLQEGECLLLDFRKRLNSFSENIDKVELAVPKLIEKREHGLSERLEKLLGNLQLDPIRLAQEVAIIADKTDVTEELVRLRSHIEQFSKFLEEEVAIGRKLDFLIQEFLREVNTLASKINDAEIAHITVELKGELEKMREQVQNIE